MSEETTCFDTIIGLVRDEGCFDNYEVDYSESKSGLYLEDLQGIRLADSCGMEVYDLMIKARRNAIHTLKTDTAQNAALFVEPNRTQFNGEIGAVQFNKTETAEGYFGLRLYTSLAGVRMYVLGCTLLPYTSGTITLYVYDDYDLLKTYTITDCVARRPKRIQFSTALELGRGNTYFLMAGSNAYSGSVTCCGHKWCFDVKKPIFNTTKRHWSSWVQVAGTQGAALDDRNDWNTYSRNFGIVLNCSFSCNKDDLMCSEEYSDFENNEHDRAFAFALLYKTGEMFLNAIMDTGEVNRLVLLSNESIEYHREEYAKKYEQMVSWYVQNMDLERNDCFQCKGLSRMTNRNDEY